MMSRWGRFFWDIFMSTKDKKQSSSLVDIKMTKKKRPQHDIQHDREELK